MQSLINKGEEVYINWNGDQKKFQKLESIINFPYLNHSKIGVKGRLNVYKQNNDFTNKYYKTINYGQFIIKKNSNLLEILNLITEKSNYDYKITIIEGWEKYQLDSYLSSFYENYKTIPYTNLIANTYIINSSNSILDLKEHLENFHFTKFWILVFLVICQPDTYPQ